MIVGRTPFLGEDDNVTFQNVGKFVYLTSLFVCIKSVETAGPNGPKFSTELHVIQWNDWSK